MSKKVKTRIGDRKGCNPNGTKFGMEVNFVLFSKYTNATESKFPTKLSSLTVCCTQANHFLSCIYHSSTANAVCHASTLHLPANPTTLAKKIETGTQAKHRRVHARQIMRLCHVRVAVSIFLARVVAFQCIRLVELRLWTDKLFPTTQWVLAVRIRHSIRKIATQPVILRIELGGKPKWLPLNHDVMCTGAAILAAQCEC